LCTKLQSFRASERPVGATSVIVGHSPSAFPPAAISACRNRGNFKRFESFRSDVRSRDAFTLVEPSESKKLAMLVKSPRQAGAIEAAFMLFYTSNNETRRKELCIRGNAVEPEPTAGL
jgi:hypothetical protein